jgi:hypothetical protein
VVGVAKFNPRQHLTHGISVFCAACAIALATLPARADDALSGPVRQQVQQTVGQWVNGGNVKSLDASIDDLCNKNPEIALDIVAYAGEVATRSVEPEECLTEDSKCTELDEVLAVLLDHAVVVSSGGKPVASSGGTDGDGGGIPVTDPPPTGGGNGNPPPDEDHAGGGKDDAPPPDEGSSSCVSTGTCGGEEPPASQTTL